MQRFPGEERESLSCDTVETEEKEDEKEVHPTCPVEFLNTVAAESALPDHIVKPRNSVILMLRQNIDPVKGHVSGDWNIVSYMGQNTLQFILATGTKSWE